MKYYLNSILLYPLIICSLFFSFKFYVVNHHLFKKEKINLENNSNELDYKLIKLDSFGLSKDVFLKALSGFETIKIQSSEYINPILTIVDFSKPSNKKRLFVIDLINKKVLFNTYVAHGRNSGQLFATSFSNENWSLKSSLGFYQTGKTYRGKHGYSLALIGLENGINDNAYERGIVIHSADYVSESTIRSQGFCGRSWGCPALPVNLSSQIIDKIKNGCTLFVFGIDESYLSKSKFLHS
jgi:hypothetical protein